MKHGYMKGDKPKQGAPIDLGLSEQAVCPGGTKMPLRGENSKNQPTRPHGSVSSDRGTFPEK